ncbi:MAG: phosphatidylserine decarboxylase family protein [Alphaproteobacteria bacterium]|nr:phosphatidylserine decarboxylase family protein [Alphaproteobacteria bacterium]
MTFHPDAWRFVAIALALAAAAAWEAWPWGALGLLLPILVALFFRDPDRTAPDRPGAVLSPADGVILSIGPAAPPPELGLAPDGFIRICVFLSVFDVHVTRAPAAGLVRHAVHRPGKYLVASREKASDDNERLSVAIETPAGPVAFALIAGLIARRIVSPLAAGQLLVAGERCGLIRFGSRSDIFIPRTAAILVAKGQRVRGGETVLADLAIALLPAGAEDA